MPTSQRLYTAGVYKQSKPLVIGADSYLLWWRISGACPCGVCGHVPFVPLMSPCGRVREAFESFLRHSPRRDEVPASATSATDDYLLLHQIVEIASCGFHTTLVLKIGMPHAPQPPARAAKTSCFSLRHKRQCSAAKPEDCGFAGGDPIPTRCPPTADVGAHRFPQSQCGAHSRWVPVGLRESRFHCTARCALSR